MTDTQGFRRKFGVLGPSTNTIVQPDFDDMRPHDIGVPHRMSALKRFLAYARQFDGVWWATREQVADAYRAQHASHITPGG